MCIINNLNFEQGFVWFMRVQLSLSDHECTVRQGNGGTAEGGHYSAGETGRLWHFRSRQPCLSSRAALMYLIFSGWGGDFICEAFGAHVYLCTPHVCLCDREEKQTASTGSG